MFDAVVEFTAQDVLHLKQVLQILSGIVGSRLLIFCLCHSVIRFRSFEKYAAKIGWNSVFHVIISSNNLIISRNLTQKKAPEAVFSGEALFTRGV